MQLSNPAQDRARDAVLRSGQDWSRLPRLVQQFRTQMERRRRYEEEWIATFERVAGNPRVRRLIQQIICEKELSRHG